MVHRGDTPMVEKATEKMRYQARLHRRGNIFYFRAKIPQDLLEHFKPRREIKFSLGTSDKRLAVARVHEESIRLDREFSALRKPTSLSAPTDRVKRRVRLIDDEFIQHICALFLLRENEGDEDLRINSVVDEETWDDYHAENVASSEQRYRNALKMGRWQEATPLLDWFLAQESIVLECSPESYKRLAFAFLKAIVRSIDVINARNLGEIVESSSFLPPGAGISLQACQGPSLDDLYVDWRDAHDRPVKTISEARSIMEELKVLSSNPLASQLAKDDVVAYRNYLSKERNLHFQTVIKKLNILRAILQKGFDDGKIQMNPANRIRVDRPKVVKPSRLSFSREDINRIFSSPLYSGGHISEGGKAETAQWLPLLALYTGAREEELGQLRVENVLHDDDVGFYINITNLGDDQTLKTPSSLRRVPVHPDLITAGFLRLVELRRKTGETKLFPKLKAASDGKVTGNWSKWWGRYQDKVIGIDDPLKVFHSFRHSFKDIARTAVVHEAISDAITGHKNGGKKKNSGRNYGGAYPLKPLLDGLLKMKFLGDKVPVLIDGI